MDYIFHYESPIGPITMSSDGQALTGLLFDDEKYFSDVFGGRAGAVKLSQGEMEGAGSGAGVCPAFAEAVRWLDIYFSGKDPGFLPPIALHTTPFRREVCEIMLTIPYGETMTYGQIAEQIAARRGCAQGAEQITARRGIEQKQEHIVVRHEVEQKPEQVAARRGAAKMSAQAVGGAVGHNPISIIIPCHRVVGTNGSLTGYAGGIDKKIQLLKLEGADMTGLFVPRNGTAL